MKPSIALLVLLLFHVLAYGQISTSYGDLIYADTLEFEPMHPWIIIDEPESNIWEAGTPSKDYFDEALSGSNAMMTDSSQHYGTSLNDCFMIKPDWDAFWWSEANLSFYHKYDTEYKKDGGIIEVSYDAGVSWLEISEDTENIYHKYIGLSQDTVKGGVKGYTGISDGWQYVELHWLWEQVTKKDASLWPGPFILRFRFLSDDNDTQHEGWMIDDIVYRGYSVSGNIEGYPLSMVRAYPNPARDVVSFLLEVNGADMEVRVYNLYGQQVLNELTSNNQINISALEHGMYLFELYRNDAYVSSGKFVKK